MNVFDLFARLSLDTSEYERSLDDAKKQSSVFGDVLKANLATDVIKKGFDVASNAISKFTTGAVSTGQQFDASMAQVAATMGVTVDEIQNLRDFAQEMGATTAFSASQAADALNFMALAGYDAETSISMLPNVLNLAAAGGMDLARASDMITDSQSALGLSLDETSELVDKMAKAASKTNTSVSQLGDAILTVGGTAKNLSGGTTELAQVLGIMADNGIKASESGTHLRNIMLAMAPSTEDAAKAMAQIGLNAYDAEGNLRPLEDVFLDMNAAMEGMTDLQKQNIITAIFNKTDLAAVNALLSTSADRWNEVSAAIDEASGAAAEMADTQLDNLQGDLTIMQSALEGAQIALSDKLTPAFRLFVQAGTSGLSQLTSILQNGEIEAALQPIANTLSNVWEIISTTIENVSPIIQESFANLQEAIQPIIDKFTEYSENGNLLNDITTIISTSITGMSVVIAGAIDTIAQIIDNIILLVEWLNSGDKAAEQLKLTVIAVTSAFVAYKAALAIGTLITTVTTAIKALTSAEVLAEIAQKALNLAMELNPIGIVIAAISALVGAFTYLWNTNETFRNFWILVWNDIKENFELVAEGLIWFFTIKIPETVDNFKAKIAEMGLKIVETGEQISKFFKETIPAKVEEAINKIKELPEKAKTWGKDLIDNFISGMTVSKEELSNAANNIAYLIKERIGFSEPEKGPLSNFHTFAPDMIDLFIRGIRENENKLKSQIEKTFDFTGLSTGFSASVSNINNAVQKSAIEQQTAIGGFTSLIPNLFDWTPPSANTATRAATQQLVEINLSIDGKVFGKIITPLVNKENERLGVSLAH